MRFSFPFLLAVLFFPLSLTAQHSSCCVPSPTQKFASLGGDKAFASDHRPPGEFIYQEEAGEFIDLDLADGPDARAWMIPATNDSGHYLFVFHEWWGLNEYVKNESKKLYDDLGGKVNIIALDLYDGKVASSQEEAQKYMQATSDERARAIISAASKYAGEDAAIGTIGWCFGGGWSLQAAIMLGDKAEACVMYYGMPEMDTDKLEKLETDVLAIFARQDAWITPDKARAFKEKMKEVDADVELLFYDANHAFANPSNPDYDSEATRQAYEQAINYLKEHLDQR
ncbi:dienelactone hydrolase family protein [Roseivirga sp. BDSF3-8]|uniref:dienelactone hydrolase family protein n=1 Tax=Roseivirga sp. BDSF3-8 TaxID=3241598 RepID=UPI0035324B86